MSTRARASARSVNCSPAKKLSCTNFTPASTRPLSCGERTLAGSVWNPRAWEYSSQLRFHTGFTASALVTTGFRLSGTMILKTPPKNAHASSQPAITSSTVWENVR